MRSSFSGNSTDREKETVSHDESGMNDAHQQQQQKINVDSILFDIVENEKEARTVPSIPTTPEDPSPSTAPSWPSASTCTSITTVTTTVSTATTTTTTTETVITPVRFSGGSRCGSDDSIAESTTPLAACSAYPTTSGSVLAHSTNSDFAFDDSPSNNKSPKNNQLPFRGDITQSVESSFNLSAPMSAQSTSGVIRSANGQTFEATFTGEMDLDEGIVLKTKPIPIDDSQMASASNSRSASTTSEDDDLLQASSNTVIAAPILNTHRNNFCTAGGATVVVAGRHSEGSPLHPCFSASQVPATASTSHRHARFVSQMSDAESLESGESFQDSDPSLHRQISGGSSAIGHFRGQAPIAPNAGLVKHFVNYNQHQIHQPAASSTAATMAAVRALSHTALASLDDDLSSRSSIAPYDFPHSPSAKHLHTEQVVSKHTLKGKLNKFQRLLDKAFALINMGTEESIIEGCGIVAKVMVNAWVAPKIGHDLAYGLCDYLREMAYFDLLLHFLLNTETKQCVRLAAGRALEECLSAPNRDYIVSIDNGGSSHRLERFLEVIKSFKEGEELRVAVSLLESLFKQSQQTNARMIELSALDYVLNACKATTNSHTLRHAALAICNLSMYSDNECQQRMIAKNVPEWLFLLASSQDDVTRYYACLAICVLVSNKEIETAVTKSGTLTLVEPFLLAHKPADFATSDYKHCQGRPQQWLAKLVPVLNAKRKESRSMAAFHFAMEAGIKRDQEALGIFEQIGAVEALKQVAALPEEVAPKFASLALEIVGEEVPYKLSHQVPLWSVEDVQYWVSHIGFEKYANSFYEQKVDGDLLLLINDTELAEDIQMKSGLLRKRFMRELESLKMAADYSCVDETQLDRFLVGVNPHFSVYTYRLLEMGVDRSILPSVTDEMMKSDCSIVNPVHRAQLLQSVQECKHIDDMEVALLSKHIDIFISYRRSTGNQLASLIKVLLQLRGYKVFIDVDRLYAGKFDSSLLKNIQAAKHFVLVLTPHALDRCVDDEDCSDWVHKEVLCALEHKRNIIPVFDPQFEWPENHLLPFDIRGVTRFNGVRWVHEYQEACVDKLEKFIEGEINIDRGYNASPQRGQLQQQQQQYGAYYRNTSKNNSISSSCGNQQFGSVPDDADLVLEALTMASRRRASSHDQLLSQ